MIDMQEWYLINEQPTFNSGCESDDFDLYTKDGFDELVYQTPAGKDVKFCKGKFNGITNKFEYEYSTKAVILNETFDAYTQGWKRTALTIIDDLVAEYKYIKFYDSLGNEQIYVIMAMPSCNGIYTKVVIHECNYTLRWQDKATGEIVYYPTHTVDATQYNTGVEGHKQVVQTGYIQLMSWISLDDITAELCRDMRMFIDVATIKPDVFIITSMSKVAYSYNESRIMRITFTEDEINYKTDRVDLLICDYINPADIPQPTTPIVISYKGNPEIRIGGRKTFTAETEVSVTFDIVNSSILDGKITISQDENVLVVKCANDPAIVGSNFKIEVAGGGQRSELLVRIISAV